MEMSARNISAWMFASLLVCGIARAQVMKEPACKADLARYERIQLGMSVEQVNGIIGCEGTYMRAWGVPQYAWPGVNGGMLVVTINSQKVAGKNQEELAAKRTGTTRCRFDEAHARRLQSKMTPQAVIEIIGCEGLPIGSQTDMFGESRIYQWSPRNQTAQPLVLTFKNGALDLR